MEELKKSFGERFMALLNEVRMRNDEIEDENVEIELHFCPVCGKHEFEFSGLYEKCPVCGWYDDPVQEDWEEDGGFNEMSLKQAREKYKEEMNKE